MIISPSLLFADRFDADWKGEDEGLVACAGLGVLPLLFVGDGLARFRELSTAVWSVSSSEPVSLSPSCCSRFAMLVDSMRE